MVDAEAVGLGHGEDSARPAVLPGRAARPVPVPEFVPPTRDTDRDREGDAGAGTTGRPTCNDRPRAIHGRAPRERPGAPGPGDRPRVPRALRVPAGRDAGRRRDVALALAALAGLVVAAVVVALEVRHRDVVVAIGESGGIADILPGLVLLFSGLLVLRGADRRGRPVGRVLSVAGAGWLATALAQGWLVEAVAVSPGLPGASFAYAVGARYGSFLLLALPLVLLLFPDGRLPRGRVGRPLAVASLAGTALLPVSLLFVPAAVVVTRAGGVLSPVETTLDLDPHPIALPFWPVVLDVAFALVPLGMVVPFAVVAVRYRRATGRRRLQLRWLVWAGLVDLLVIGVGLLLAEPGRRSPCSSPSRSRAARSSPRWSASASTRSTGCCPDLVAVALALLVLAVDGVVLLVAGAAFDDRDSAWSRWPSSRCSTPRCGPGSGARRGA